MSNENNNTIDFDGLIEEDDTQFDTLDKQDKQSVSFETSNKNKNTKKGKKVKGRKIKVSDPEEQKATLLNILLKHVLPLLGTAIIVAIISFMVAKTFYSEPETEVTGIVEKTSIDDVLSTYQKDQVSALRSQFKALDPNDDTSLSVDKPEVAPIIKDMEIDADEIVEPFMNKLLTLSRYSDDNEKEIMRKDLMDYTTDSGANALYPLLTSVTPAMDLEEDGTKAGSTFLLLSGMDSEGSPIYLALTPYKAGDKIINATYVVKVNKSSTDDKEENKIDFITYAGILGTDKVNNTTYKAINDALKGESYTKVENKQDEDEKSDKDAEEKSDDKE